MQNKKIPLHYLLALGLGALDSGEREEGEEGHGDERQDARHRLFQEHFLPKKHPRTS